MNEDWRTFIRDRGTPTEVGSARGAAVAQTVSDGASVYLVDLSHYGLVSVQGDDATAFLQGQLTCDVQGVTQEHSVLGAYLSPKGRILASFRIARRDEEFLIRVPSSVVETTVNRLRMFVLRSRVGIEDRRDAEVVFGIGGTGAETRIRAAAGQVPNTVDESVQVDDTTIVRVPGSEPRYEVYGSTENAARLWAELDGFVVGSDAWELFEIRSGLPTIGAENCDAFVPQMVNLELVGGVSFTKGCYSGQEVVARTQYLGRPKRRMYRAAVSSMAKPRIGGPVVVATPEGKKEIGRVVSSASSPDGGFEILAVLQTAAVVDGQELRVADGSDVRLEIRDLPYSV